MRPAPATSRGFVRRPARSLPARRSRWHTVALLCLTTSVEQDQVLQPRRVARTLAVQGEGTRPVAGAPKTACRTAQLRSRRPVEATEAADDEIPGHEEVAGPSSPRTILPRLPEWRLTSGPRGRREGDVSPGTLHRRSVAIHRGPRRPVRRGRLRPVRGHRYCIGQSVVACGRVRIRSGGALSSLVRGPMSGSASDGSASRARCRVPMQSWTWATR